MIINKKNGIGIHRLPQSFPSSCSFPPSAMIPWIALLHIAPSKSSLATPCFKTSVSVLISFFEKLFQAVLGLFCCKLLHQSPLYWQRHVLKHSLQYQVFWERLELFCKRKFGWCEARLESVKGRRGHEPIDSCMQLQLPLNVTHTENKQLSSPKHQYSWPKKEPLLDDISYFQIFKLYFDFLVHSA